MNEEMYQNIFDEISPLLPENWSRIIYRVFYTQGNWSMKFYADPGDGKYVDCFKLLPGNRASILQAFRSIDQVISPVRDNAPDNEKWTAMTLSVSADGAFHADFDYADLSEIIVDYTIEWEKKYLN